MHPIIEEIYRTREIPGADGKPREAFPASLNYDDGMALYRVVRDAKATRTLEVGMAYGVSSLFIMQGIDENGGGQHVSIDPWQAKWWEDIGVHTVSRAGYAKYHTLHRGPSYEVMPELVKAPERYDFIFIDGNHRFEYTLMDFMYADLLLNTGGYLMLHDPWLPSIRKVVSFIATNRPEAYELAVEYMHPHMPLINGVINFLRSAWKHPYDLYSARFFARKTFANYVVFRKKLHVDRETYDAAWDFYRPF